MRTLLLLCSAACVAAASCATAAEETNPMLAKLEPGKWTKIHEQKKGDKVVFMRQAHGGSCFDTKRGRIILFGSNTHGKDWKNSPFFFDVAACEWTRLYPDDPQATYTVDANGLAVAGEKRNHPWATHTFGAVEYDPKRDEMIVACYPSHMVPGRFSNALKDVWGKVKKHPTWTLRLETNEWVPLPCKPVHFFPYCAAFDTDRHVVIGHSPGGVYELGGEPRQWTQVVRGGKFGWHTNAVYDSKHAALVVFGSNRNANDIVAYKVKTKEYKMMPTPGDRPPKDQHNPMAFHAKLGRTAVLVDHVLDQDGAKKTQTETWLYDLGADQWEQVRIATLPFGCGMNYNMEYDTKNDVLLLVTGDYGRPTEVWALRVK